MIKSWERDEEITYCNMCKNKFSLFIRKHHCRQCGKIFCYKCIIYSKDKTRYILCNTCQSNRKYDFLLNIIKTVGIYDLKDLKSLSLVNKNWYHVTKIILNDFYRIQFNFNKLSKYEKELITHNTRYIAGHFNYIYKSLFFKKDNLLTLINTNKKTECSNIKCINCSNININNYICLLNSEYLYEYYTELILSDKNIRHELIFYICSHMYKYLTSIDDEILTIIKKYSKKNKVFFFWFFWSLEQLSFINKEYYEFYQTVRNSIFINFDQEQRSIIKEIYNFIDLMKSVDITNSIDINFNLINSYLLAKKPIYMFDFNDRLVQLLDISLKNSNSRPIVYTFKTKRNKTVSFLFKKENIQIDLVIINCIHYTKKLLNQIIPEEHITTYNVIPYKNKFGLIEIVNDCITLSDINKSNISLSNFIFNNNRDNSIHQIRTNFLYSLAFYSMICYILGLGDRHLDNIMITNTGLLFHIDFSFILGEDPKKQIAPEIRITQQMIDVLGGSDSEYYKKFQLVCRKSFMKIKYYFNSYYELLRPIVNLSEKYSELKIQNFLKGRFMTDLAYNVADIKFNNKVLLDTSSQSQLIDYIHSYAAYKDGLKSIVSDKLYSLW